MKLYWIVISLIAINLLTSCATHDNKQVPSLESFQTKTLPTGGSDAALSANRM